MGGMTGNMINTRNGNHNFTEITNIESLYKKFNSENFFFKFRLLTEMYFYKLTFYFFFIHYTLCTSFAIWF